MPKNSSPTPYIYETIEYPKETVRSQAVVEDAPTSTAHAVTKGQVQRAVAKSADPLAILKGVTAAHTPAQITELIRQAQEFAVSQRSWEGLLAIVKLELEYSVGKPVQRSIHAEITPETFAKWFTDEAVSDGDSEGMVPEEVVPVES